ncbi:MAG: cation-transporting P-type ATPase [Peptococcaceae bacterium]|nr:cation-transporting P-type ATPase [Peptococcaceae bacterium]
MEKITAPWAIEKETVTSILRTSAISGLSSAAAENSLKETGENTITESKKITFLDILLEEIKEPLILMLIAIGVLYSILGDIGDAIAILCIILTVALVEVYTEYQAKKSIESMRTMARPTSWVIRDGKPVEIAAGKIVTGDILILRAGVNVSADARILECTGLEADESQLTGESLGVQKTVAVIPADTLLNDRVNMVHMGSVILKGKGLAVVTATGMDTELGRIAGLTAEAREPKTPMQKSMKQLSKTLIWVAVFFTALIMLLNFMRGLSLPETILLGLAFAFATIPEEMPIIITMALGLAAITLSKKSVLIKRTKAAETLGGVTVIATDKTGTITENKMSIKHRYAKDELLLFTYATLLADVETDSEGNFLGDPMDKAVVLESAILGAERCELLKVYKLTKDYGFNETAKTFQMEFEHNGKRITLLKGAPESVLALSEPDQELQGSLVEAMSEGLRTIAVAVMEDLRESFALVGFICFEDPVREGVHEAVGDCFTAGVRVVMITGDHGATAKRVAENVGIPVNSVITGAELTKQTDEEIAATVRDNNVFARISPEQKLRIVNALRENGEVIAVTGDGINDAPALKTADIGIAMGVTGTDVAKEAADMLLTDDSFASIVSAISEGRRLYDNLSKCVKYYLGCKVGLILSLLVPTIMGLPLPFSPIQIIVLELFMDVAAATSFVIEKAESNVMQRKPRNPKERFMNRQMNMGIISIGVTLAAVVLGAYLFAYYTGIPGAPTLAFIAWMFANVALGLHTRTVSVPLLKVGIFSNKAFILWTLGVIAFLATALNTPVLREYLQLSQVGFMLVLYVVIISVAATMWIEIRKWVILNYQGQK